MANTIFAIDDMVDNWEHYKFLFVKDCMSNIQIRPYELKAERIHTYTFLY